MISLSAEELLELLSEHRITSGETSLVIGQDGYAAVHHEGKIKCFLPDLERVFAIYRENAQQGVESDEGDSTEEEAETNPYLLSHEEADRLLALRRSR
jgi:hypothetical protein